MQKSFKEILKTNKIITLDGAMATELEKRGVETDNELWSAMALIKQPEAVKAVHQSYFLAGADVATTDSYQANLPAFEKIGLSLDDSKKLVTESVKLAQEARDEFWDSLSSEQKIRGSNP
jgi:Homocysteine/selenocysteine methylase (S-methylmethionine-dependent)